LTPGNSYSLLYDTTNQLVDAVASFFDAGLRNDECCFWGVAGQFDIDNVKGLLKDAGLDVDKYVEKGQLIFSQCNECYIAGKDPVSDMDLLKWEEVYDIAIAEGYNGLRIVDKFTIVDDHSWDSFVEYEKQAMALIRTKKITGLFAFLLEARSRMEMIELISMHDGTIIEKNGRWTLLQSSSSCKTVSRSQYFRDEILENVWTGFWAVDENDKIVFFNKGMESISGLSKKDVCGKKLTNFIPQSGEGEHPGFADVFQAVKEDLRSRSYDVFPFIKPDGQFIYHSGFLLPLTDDEGNYSGMIGTIGKLVEQTIDHETLRDKFKSIEKLEDIYRMSPVVAFLWSAEKDWPIAFVSENILQFGYTPADLTSGKMNYGDIIHPDDRDYVRSDVSELEIQGKMFFSKEYRLMTKSGKVRWVTERSHLIRNEKGNPAYYQGIIIDITDRKEAEEKLQKSEALLAEVSRIAKIGGWEFDPATGKGTWTAEIATIHELDPSAPTDVEMGLSFYSPGSKEIIKKAVADAVQEGKAYDLELEMITAKGTPKWVRTIGHPIIKDGKVVHVTGALQDITERKKAEEAVHEAEKKYRLIFENSPVGIFHFNAEGIVTHCNEKFLQIIGVENKDDVIGFNMVTQTQDEDMKKAVSDVLSRKDGHFEGKFHTVISGKDLYLKADFSPNLADDGTMLGGIGIYGDVSIRKKAEEALRLDESRLEALLKISHVTDLSLTGVADFVQEEAVRLTQSKIGYLAFLNDAGTKLTIYSWSRSIMDRCRVKGKKLEYTIEETGLWGEPIRQKKAVIVNDFEAPNPLKHGYPEGHISLRRYMSIPIFDGKKIVGVAGVGNKEEDYDKTDVRQLTLFMEGMWKLIQRQKSEDTLRKYADELSKVNEELSKTNEELSEANVELKSLDRMKDDFLSNVSHEFKTPLTSIQGYSQLISDGTLGEVNEQQQKAVETVLRNSERLRRLVDSLLYLSRAQSGKLNYSFEMLEIKDVIDHSVQDLALQATSKNIELITDIPSDMPQVVVDRDKMMDVFVNLIDNAVKFTPDGGKVTVSAHVSEDSMYMDVMDTGIGIPEDKIPMLFQRFYQVDSSVKRRYGGTGLGLYICKKIVEDHKGDIYVNSEEGKGTTVHVRLPLVQS
jgi:PAS domain S-box-containing protein